MSSVILASAGILYRKASYLLSGTSGYPGLAITAAYLTGCVWLSGWLIILSPGCNSKTTVMLYYKIYISIFRSSFLVVLQARFDQIDHHQP